MRSLKWPSFKPVVSTVDRFYGGAYPATFDRENPHKTFVGITYRLRVAEEHSGWDHAIGHVYETKFEVAAAGEKHVSNDYTEVRTIIKRNVPPGDFIFTIHYYHYNDVINQIHFEGTVFDPPLGEGIFYVRPLLIHPTNVAVKQLWNSTLGTGDNRGFEIKLPPGFKPYLVS